MSDESLRDFLERQADKLTRLEREIEDCQKLIDERLDDAGVWSWLDCPTGDEVRRNIGSFVEKAEDWAREKGRPL